MTGRIFLFGDNIDTDQLAPGKYMRGGIAELAAHCLESARPDFAQTVSAGDILVGGRNFGAGSSREQAAEVLRYLKVAGVVAISFAGIFYRNAINLGLPVLIAPDISIVNDGDQAALDPETGTLRLIDKAIDIDLEPVPENLVPLLRAGGLVPFLKERLARERVT